ncbi:hypothetical protein [Polymorphospora sp. NPDC050346]|uniref:hypothetical protein n=1 Tax=Polymorphospora sp. NPDC050346 TaxID=3155780 RepID=UPI0033E747BD
MHTDAELVLGALLAAQADGDDTGMRQIADHVTPATRAEMLDLVAAELTDRTLAQIADADQMATLLLAGSVYSRLDRHDPLIRHQVVHPYRPVVDALRWELGDRAANALRCW